MHARGLATAVAGAVLAGLVAVTSPTGAEARPDAGGRAVFREGFDGVRPGVAWQDGQIHGRWRSQFHGWGTTAVTDVEGRRVLMQRPRPAMRPDHTDASLVTTTRDFGDLELTASVRTLQQLRIPEPNPWEVAWLLWHYTDNTHFYYVALKPDGWELGKEDPAYPGAQRFLATGTAPGFPVGQWYDVRIRQAGDTTTVWVDGQRLVRFRDTERPYRRGAVGLYNEDAAVQFADVTVVAR
jgi:hypothetical protein